MLLAPLQARFVSVYTETWNSKEKGPGRRDTITVCDQRTGEVFPLQPPRLDGGGIHPVVLEAQKLGFGVEVVVQVEQRSYVPPGARFATTSYVAHDVVPAKNPVNAAPAAPAKS